MSLSSRKRKQKAVVDDNDSEDLFGLRSPAKNSVKKQQKLNDDTVKDSSIFGELITKSGFILKRGNQPNILKCDQAVFQMNLKKALLLHPQHGKDDFVDQFIKTLENHVQNAFNLKWALLYTQTAQDCSSCRGGQQDSLVRLLLNIDELQPKLIILLTEKLLEVAYDEEERENVDLPSLILANLRWLDHVVDSAVLTEKVIDLLQGSPLEIQKEVINFVPNIVDDTHHPKIAEVLCDLYESTPELTSPILDSLSYLTLEPDGLQDIHHSVLKTLHTVKPYNLPIVVKFLLHNTPPNMAYQVVSDIRETISLPGDEKSSASSSQIPSSRRMIIARSLDDTKEKADLEVLIFSNIKMTVLIHKYLTGALLKSIYDVKDIGTIRPFDLLVLIMIYEVVPARRKGIESILRNMVRLGLPIDPFLSSTFANHSAVLKEYFEAVKKVAGQLIRCPEMGIACYGVAMYKCCFVSLDSYQQQDIVLSLLSHIGDNENVRSASLSLLSQLAHEHTTQMTKYTLFLKGSLDIMDILSLREAKKLMDAIIHLAHSSDDESSLREELSILIRKQLSHSDIKFKRLGVMSAVLTLKNSVGEGSETSVESLDDEDSTNFSDGPLKEAEVLFHTVRESTIHSPRSSALFMDELATNILKNGLNPKLEKWISTKMMDDFEGTFVLDCDTSPTDEFPFAVSYQWNLEELTDSEQIKSIAIGITKFVIEACNNSDKEVTANENIIVTLAPHFRLMRMVESHLYSGNLDNIEAVLGCGVQMPNPSVYDNFLALSDKEQTVVLSCLFYAINWFREVVNAFVTQKDPENKKRVTWRLRKIITLQDLLSRLLPQKPSYTPPSAVFDFDLNSAVLNVNAASGSGVKKGKPKAPKKGTKRKQKADEAETLMTGISQPLGTQTQLQKPSTANSQESGVANLKNFKAFFRELHLDVFNLLFKNLCLDFELDQESVKYLSLTELEFLLLDLNQKFSRVFESGTKRSTVLGKSGAERDAGFSHFDVFTADEVAKQALRYIKPVCAHLEKISDFFQGLIADNDGIEDAPNMFTERTIAITNLYTSLFTTLRLFLSWPSLHAPDHSTILTNILRLLGKKLEGDSVTQMNKEELLAASFRYLSNFSNSVVNISTAVALVHLLDILISFAKNEELKIKLVETIDKFLKKEWYTYGGNTEKGSAFNHNLHSLLKIFFRHSIDRVTAIYTMATNGISELSESAAKDASSELYPTIKKSTMPVYYSILLENLVSGTAKLLSTATNNSDNSRHLEIWNISIKTLHALVEPLKSFSSTLMFASFLKYSHGYLELFLRKGMPLMDKCLQKKQKEVTSLFKNLQTTTRFLQHLCTHAKCNQDTRLVRFVPLVKKSLEEIVFRVKAMLALNRCQDAFFLGNLKNRDLQGEELLSQSIQDHEIGNEEGEEVPDDGLSDVDLDEDSNDAKSGGGEESYSVSY